MDLSAIKIAAKRFILPVIRSRGMTPFTLRLPMKAWLLDVGCGNAAPLRAKTLRPDLYYVGLDIGDHNQTDISKSFANEYHLTRPEAFDSILRGFGSNKFDAVICAHNIEHTQKPYEVLRAICAVLKPGGQLYLSFPSEKTLSLPRRKGTLNFYDDDTHVWLPPFDEVVACLKENSVDTVHQIREYRPLIYLIFGVITEPYSILKGKIGPFGGTWALHGFESIIWGVKASSNLPTI